MISQIHIQNFKCLRDVKVDLAPLTVLIGPNNSGKTSLLEAIALLGETTTKNLFGQDSIFGNEIDPSLAWRRQKKAQIILRLNGIIQEPIGTKFEYQLCIYDNDVQEILLSDDKNYAGAVLNEERKKNSNYTSAHTYLQELAGRNQEPHYAIAESIRSSQIYKFDPAEARSPSSPTGGLLSARGDNLAAVLDALVTGPDRASFDALEKTLTKTFPDLAGITLPSSKEPFIDSSGQKSERLVKSIEFVLAGKERPKVTIPAQRVSDGVMLLTAYLALAYSDTPEIILLEEPENGLHPSRLKMVIDMLRQMTRGETGNKKRQILLTTHSPLLLNYCEKDEVRIVRRAADGGSEVTPLSAVPGIDKLLNEFAIGELWNLLGEEGLLKEAAAGARA